MRAVLIVWLFAMAALPAAGQEAVPSLRTAWGAPDLQGTWSTSTTTPMQRPRPLAGREFLTGQEAADYARAVVEGRDVDKNRQPGTLRDVTGSHDNYWFDNGDTYIPTLRTSLIIDPKDGRIPPRTPDGQAREAKAIPYSGFHDGRSVDSWADRGLWERCITRGLPGVMLPTVYNNHYQIFQTPDYVAILHEMIHDARIIPLDNRPHLAAGIRQWMGDSVGHWEGDVLVVDTTNFSNRTDFYGAEERLHLIERFRRASPDILVYQATFDDPSTFVQPWTFELPVRRIAGRMYEYACHEGNLSMTHVLAGSRAKEQQDAAGKAPH